MLSEISPWSLVHVQSYIVQEDFTLSVAGGGVGVE